MLQNLTVDPDITQKRMGDGFYEQRLITRLAAATAPPPVVVVKRRRIPVMA